MRRKLMPVSLAVVILCSLSAARAMAAADTWFEIKSPNFTVLANANDGSTRTLIWQFEQIRNVAKTLWPWMQADLPKPLTIIAVKDEKSMRALLPWHWEQKGGVRPGSVWVSGPDSHYIAIRADMRDRDDVQINPHTSAYFAYANLSLTSRFEHPLPPWLSRGLAGVLSNTLVRQKDVIVGAMIPWHLEELRQRRRPLRQILTATWGAPELRRNETLGEFDAHAWAFVHMMMFGYDGKNSGRLNNFVAEVAKGTAHDAAFASTVGNVEQYERDFVNYVNRTLFPAIRVNIDAGVDRERFPARKLTDGESAGARAGFLVAMNRPDEAQAMIAQARKSEADSAAATTAEALLFDRSGNREGAKAGYAKAVSQGSTSAYAFYRLAVLSRAGADGSGLEKVEQHLAKAVELNPNFAAAHASLAETRAELKRSQAVIVPHMHKAVSLEPGNAWHRILAARTLARLDAFAEARQTAETARKLATDDPAAQQEIARILALLKGR